MVGGAAQVGLGLLNGRVLSFMAENDVLSLHLGGYVGLCEAFKCHAGVLFKRQLVPCLWLTNLEEEEST